VVAAGGAKRPLPGPLTPTPPNPWLTRPQLPIALGIGHNERVRQVLIYRGEDGFWIAECPSLPGCVTQGETQNAALANIKEAVQAYVGALEVDNLPVPEEHFDARLVTV
jgi:predicted RNase H-like HicB family nuclease